MLILVYCVYSYNLLVILASSKYLCEERIQSNTFFSILKSKEPPEKLERKVKIQIIRSRRVLCLKNRKTWLTRITTIITTIKTTETTLVAYHATKVQGVQNKQLKHKGMFVNLRWKHDYYKLCMFTLLRVQIMKTYAVALQSFTRCIERWEPRRRRRE